MSGIGAKGAGTENAAVKGRRAGLTGYFGRMLDVDLSAGSCAAVELEESFLRRYVGGRGFGAKLVWDNLVANEFSVDPLGPENIIVIAPGPLTGSYLPASGKCSFVAVSPATRAYGDSSMGGSFGVELRQSGFDAIRISGRARELSILVVDGLNARVQPMPDLAGKSCLEAEGIIKERLGSRELEVAVIGVAGENLVRFACINADWSRNAGRTGMGAVLGSKNLKAIVLRGGEDLPVANLQGLQRETERAFSYMKEHEYFSLWQREGLMNVMEYANRVGILPTRNFSDTAFSGIKGINGETMLRDYKIGDTACFACSMNCGNICLVKQGKYRGTVAEGPEYESCAMLGSNLGVDSFAAVLKANQMCDELGIDTISTGNLIGAVIEGYERGVISLEDLGGKPVSWGDEERILEMIGQIAHREGIGETLADGARAVVRRWPAMKEFVLEVKGVEQSAYDSRAGASMALAYATSDIGAHHSRAWTIAREIEMGQDWSAQEKVDLVIYHQTLRPLFDMLGVCRLPWIELGLNEKHYARFYSFITGEETSLDELLERSAEIYELTRLINTRLGLGRGDDTMPYKVSSVPVRSGPTAGKVVSEEEFTRLLELYYRRRGWDSEGKPPAESEARFQ